MWIGFSPAGALFGWPLKTIHPFPARMAPQIVFEYLPSDGHGKHVLDPMSGSGTTLVAARMRGYNAIGVDTDPLAVSIARANCADLHADRLLQTAEAVIKSARRRAARLKQRNAYPAYADFETREFVRFWFDQRARVELTSIARALDEAPKDLMDFLRCAFSRMIITKKSGVSLAEDVSHSRPHKTRDHPPIYPLENFLRCIEAIVDASSFADRQPLPKAKIISADCRRLPFADGQFDHIITSPPYLNAIDYLRGHKMSLVWLGWTISELRELRSRNVGSERGSDNSRLDPVVRSMVTSKRTPERSLANRLRRYVVDLDAALAEMRRVARPNAQCVVVIGDSTVGDCDVRNSIAVDLLARQNGFALIEQMSRRLLDQHRYLPPPTDRFAGARLKRRMRKEIILRYRAV